MSTVRKEKGRSKGHFLDTKLVEMLIWYLPWFCFPRCDAGMAYIRLSKQFFHQHMFLRTVQTSSYFTPLKRLGWRWGTTWVFWSIAWQSGVQDTETCFGKSYWTAPSDLYPREPCWSCSFTLTLGDRPFLPASSESPSSYNDISWASLGPWLSKKRFTIFS